MALISAPIQPTGSTPLFSRPTELNLIFYFLFSSSTESCPSVVSLFLVCKPRHVSFSQALAIFSFLRVQTNTRVNVFFDIRFHFFPPPSNFSPPLALRSTKQVLTKPVANGKLSKDGKDKEIPIPEIRNVQTYEQDYRANYAQSVTYLRSE